MCKYKITLIIIISFIALCLTTFVITKVINLGDLKAQTIFYISPLGDDNSPGTKAKPFKTIQKSQEAVALINKNMSGDIIVYLRDGKYYLNNTLTFNEKDSGSNGHKIIYTAYKDEKPTLDGGKKITNWSPYKGKIYKANVDIVNFRQLYVNGSRAQRAWSDWTTYKSNSHEFSDDISDITTESDGIKVDSSTIGNWKNQSDIELISTVEWYQMRYPVKNIIDNGASKIIKMKQPFFSWGVNTITTHPWTINSSFYIENALELLDKPGEWYYDKSTHTLYYMPRPDEKINTAEVYAPATRGIINIKGSSFTKKVHDIKFQGLYFQHDTWLEPSEKGYSGWQAVAYFTGNNKTPETAIVPGAIQIDCADSIIFEKNTFEHLGASGITMTNAVNNTQVIGNTFSDISSSAFIIGDQNHLTTKETQQVCKDDLFKNNIVYNVAQEYWMSPSLISFVSDGLEISHNEIYNSPYSAISVGWGWSNNVDSKTCKNNKINYNKISNTMTLLRDGGGIYTLGNQPNSEVKYNYITGMYNDFGAIYHDEGSAYFTTANNVLVNIPIWIHMWTPSIHDITVDKNYTTTRLFENKGTNCKITNTSVSSDGNLPKAALDIIGSSGLEPGYKSLLKSKIIDLSNKVIDSGFEKGLFTWKQAWTVSLDTHNVKSGNYACCIKGASSGISKVVSDLQPNTNYKLKVWGKVSEKNTQIKIGLKNYGGSEQSSIITNCQYAQTEISFKTGKGNTSVEIYAIMAMDSKGEGAAYVDDFEIVKN